MKIPPRALRHGRTVLAEPVTNVDASKLATAMIGGAPPAAARRERRQAGQVVLAADHLAVRDERGVMRTRDVSLAVRSGEVLGVAGVDGAGQHELLLCLAGRLPPSSGHVEAPATVGFVPEDRLRDALILEFDVAENLALHESGRARGRLAWSRIRARAAEILTEYDVRAQSADALVSTLSGGNQQKLVLARELEPHPSLLIVENPTRGLDIAATAAVHSRLFDACEAGAAVVVYSSDLDEVLALADRLIVMFEGRSRDVPLDRAAAGRAMLGAA